MLVPWIQENVRVLAQLSRIDARKTFIQKIDNIYIGREDDKSILSYVDFLRLCIIIK